MTVTPAGLAFAATIAALSNTVIPAWHPARSLLILALAGLLGCLWVVWLACQPPWLGLALKADHADGLRIASVVSFGPSADLRGGQRLLAIGHLKPQARDLIEDPDQIPDYVQLGDFLTRQSQLHDLLQTARLRAEPVRLSWLDEHGQAREQQVIPGQRPLADLPLLFWFQLACALGGLLIASWVLVLRPGDRAARLFALTGLCMFVAILCNALYGNRELALDGGLLRGLDTLNHLAAFVYGCALINLFLVYPRALVAPRQQLWPWLIYLPWWLLDATWLAPDQNWGNALPLFSQLLVISLLALLHWRRSRQQPLERAALRWFLLSFLSACWLYVFTTLGPQLLGQPLLIPQGYASGFLLLIYLGLALGISHYRLFELDQWAYRILLTVVGAVAVAGLDLLLIWALHLDPLFSLGWALFMAGWLYFPLRQWLWQRLAGKPATRLEEVMPDLLDIAFTASAEGREQRWQQLLRRLFAPLRLLAHDAPLAQAQLAEQGLVLRIPACAGLQARELHYASQGKRLFSPRDAEFAQGLTELMTRAAASRDAYERGASEERGRVYRDLHDDIGAKLLSLVIDAETPQRADTARTALQDLRDVVSRSGRGPQPLSYLLADWRAEMDGRLKAAGLRLIWRQPFDLPDPNVAPATALHLGRILREAVSNVLRHAQAGTLSLSVQFAADELEISLRDDGLGLPAPQSGKGLTNMRNRAEQLGGRIDWLPVSPQGCEVRLTLPSHALPVSSED